MGELVTQIRRGQLTNSGENNESKNGDDFVKSDIFNQ
jgi:hypothetical protein